MHGDPLWMRALLMVHIACGIGSFVLAPIAFVTVKGGKQHRRWGMIYLWSMGGVAATAIPMALYRPVLFLALVAVFSFYSAFSAYRILKLKALARGGSAKPIDWISAGITFCSSAALALLAIFKPHAVQNMGVTAIVFGLVGMTLAFSQVKTFLTKPTDSLFWLNTHIGNFIGSYIAAWSAFSVVTLSRYLGNAWYVWLWPTLLGVPAIFVTVGYFRRKFASKVQPSAALALAESPQV